MKMSKIYCIGLGVDLFVCGERFFSDLKECNEYVEHMEKVYSNNKGLYKIYELKECE